MRLWSLHPRFLDRQGLTACWREALLAQAVLAGATRGYTRHPQLERFREGGEPVALVGAYLTALADEATNRGYRFDRGRIRDSAEPAGQLTVTVGQLAYEWGHLTTKLAQRSPDVAERWQHASPEPHPLFRVVPGSIAGWERFGRASGRSLR